jgi:hypothetical protein
MGSIEEGIGVVHIVVKVINNHLLFEHEVLEEILLAETRMNDGSKLRFHILGESDYPMQGLHYIEKSILKKIKS